MRIQFKILMTLMLVTSLTLNAQREEIYSKAFQTNASTTAFLNLAGAPLKIEGSPDDKFYIEYFIEFGDSWSKKRKSRKIEEIKIEATLKNNHIQLEHITQWYALNEYYDSRNQFDWSYALYDRFNNKDSIYLKKSTTSFLSDLKTYAISDPTIEYIKRTYENEKIRNKRLENYKERKTKGFKTYFVIKIPTHVDLTIKAKGSNILIRGMNQNKLSLRLNKGVFKANNLNNEDNVIKIDDTYFIADKVNGGEYTFNNSKEVLIGEANNTNIVSEFSNLQIGEVQENVNISGFNNKLLIHNFSDNFNDFIVNDEYSKINLFYPKSDYALETYGFNTAHYVNKGSVKGVTITKGKKTKMLMIKPKGVTDNKIQINIVHGIVRIDKEEIRVIE